MGAVGGAGETELIRVIKPYLSEQAGGDDAAVLDPVDQYEVVSTDMSVEGVHFDLSWSRPDDVGWRALALALGDLAAKGAHPRWALAAIAVRRDWNVGDLAGIFRGMHGLASKLSMRIEGGDLSATDGPAMLALTVGGHAGHRPVPRSAARPGWVVAVTGPLGASALALREHRALRLEPRIEEGRRLNAMGLCCGDISDGLVRELEKFAEMAGVGFRLDATSVPIAEGASLEDALSSGEEVELLCAGPPEAMRAAGLVQVGSLTEHGASIAGVHDRPRGYDHFA